jgi:hypothetical protein
MRLIFKLCLLLSCNILLIFTLNNDLDQLLIFASMKHYLPYCQLPHHPHPHQCQGEWLGCRDQMVGGEMQALLGEATLVEVENVS